MLDAPKSPPMPTPLTDYERGKLDAFHEVYSSKAPPDPGFPVTVCSVPGSAWDILAKDAAEWKERAQKAEEKLAAAYEDDHRADQRIADLKRLIEEASDFIASVAQGILAEELLESLDRSVAQPEETRETIGADAHDREQSARKANDSAHHAEAMGRIIEICAPDLDGTYDRERQLWEVEQIARGALSTRHQFVPYPGPRAATVLPRVELSTGFHCPQCRCWSGDPFEEPSCGYIDGRKHQWAPYVFARCECGNGHTCPKAAPPKQEST